MFFRDHSEVGLLEREHRFGSLFVPNQSLEDPIDSVSLSPDEASPEVKRHSEKQVVQKAFDGQSEDSKKSSEESERLQHAHQLGTLKENRVGIDDLLGEGLNMEESFADNLLDKNFSMGIDSIRPSGELTAHHIGNETACFDQQ